MKKSLFIASMLLVTIGLQAQKLDKAKKYLEDKKLAEAKTEIENFLAIDKNKLNAEAIYVKGKIYLAISKDAALKGSQPDAKDIAFEAVKQYRSLEAQNVKDTTKRYMSMMLDNNYPLFDLYKDYSADGATFYNANNFNDALTNFGKCVDVFTYLLDSKLIPAMFDTTTVLYTGICAEKAQKPDVAAKYYGMIAEKKIKSEGFLDIYKWLTDFYSRKDDKANTEKYLNLGRSVYPTDSFWDAFDLENVREKGSKEDLYKKYEEIIARNPDNVNFVFNYGVDLYQAGYDPEVSKRPGNSKELIAKALVYFKKAIELKPDFANANMVIGQLIYNEGVDINNVNKTIRPQNGQKLKPEELKKKDELRKETAKKFEEALPYFEKVEKALDSQAKLKMDDKTILKECFDTMIIIYETLDKKEKAQEYTDKYNGVDKKH